MCSKKAQSQSNHSQISCYYTMLLCTIITCYLIQFLIMTDTNILSPQCPFTAPQYMLHVHY